MNSDQSARAASGLRRTWLLGGWSPDFSQSSWTMALAAATVATCVVQSMMGWNVVMSAVGFVPSAVWDPSSWFSKLPGQMLPVALTWVTYVFPHMGWGHMTGNVLLLLMFGSVVEPRIGTPAYVVVTGFAVVFGVFGFAMVYPLGADAIAGGSLLMCTVAGVWLAMFTQAWWRTHRRLTLTFEVAVLAGFAAYLALRALPSNPSGLLAALWHLPSLMLGWFGYQVISAFSGIPGDSVPD